MPYAEPTLSHVLNQILRPPQTAPQTAPQSPPQNPPTTQAQNQAPYPEAPFEIRVEHRDVDARGYFRPQAHVAFAAPLREGGFLAALPPEALRDLLLLLSFVSPNGHCAPVLHQIAGAMRVSEGKARSRLRRLVDHRFAGRPLLVHGRTESGLEFFSPCPWLAPAREDARATRPDSSPLPIRAASREAVIEHSRATYGRPREEVERQIEDALGYQRPRAVVALSPEEEAALTEEERETRREREEVWEQLRVVGLLPEQAQALLDGYDLLGIRRQLAWLPHRRAKNPAGMLLAAVKDNYEAPPGLWRSSPPEAAPNEPVKDQQDARPVEPAVGAAVGAVDGSNDIQLEVP